MSRGERGAQAPPARRGIFQGRSGAGSSRHTSVPSPTALSPDSQDRWQGRSATNQGPCPQGRELPTPSPTAQMCHSMNRTQGLGAPRAARALTQPEKQILAKSFKRDSFLLQACVMGGHFSAAVAQGWKQSRAGSRRAGAVTRLALPPPFQPPHPAGTASSSPSPTKSEISLQPVLLTPFWAEASAVPKELLLAWHGGDSAPVAPPAPGP